MKKTLVLAAVLVCLGLGTVHAYVITFNSLTGENYVQYHGSIEGNFTVTPTSGSWFEAHYFGNPIPSIFGTSSVGVVTLTENTTGLFTFTSVDLGYASSGGTPGTYTLEGFRGGVSQFSLSGSFGYSFPTILSPDSLQVLDALSITMYRGLASHNIDNIIVYSVPEPASLMLLGLAGLALKRRSKVA